MTEAGLALRIDSLTKSYTAPDGEVTPVLDIPSFALARGEQIALCGASGSGKTAKQVYLSATPQMRPIHTKSYLQATLFGLPMLQVDFPAARRGADITAPVVAQVQPVLSRPGSMLGLAVADLAVNPVLTPTQVVLTKTETTPLSLPPISPGLTG